MEIYPKLPYKVSRFSDFSSQDFSLVIESIKRRYGSAVLDYWADEQNISTLVHENTEQEKQAITEYWVKEAVREYHYRSIEKQFR
jgi:hypothetical protein